MDIQEYKQNIQIMVNYTVNTLDKVLDNYRYIEEFMVMPTYEGMSIGVDGTLGTYIYIRLERQYRNGVEHLDVINIANIVLSEQLKRKGLFTNIVKSLSKKYTIMVSNVLTDEIRMACNKLGMQYDQYANSYYLYK